MNHRPALNLILVDSPDIVGSIGGGKFLKSQLQSDSLDAIAVDVRVVSGGRCDLVAQQLGEPPITDLSGVPAGLETWFSKMTARVSLPETTSLLAISMTDAVIGQVWRHKTTGVLIQPPIGRSVCWTPEQNSWLDEDFIEVPPTNDTLANALRSIAERMAALDAGFIVFNVSTFVPNEKVYWFNIGDPETTAIRAGRVNLVVEKLMAELDITLVDVDRIVAEIGAGEAVIGPMHYTSDTMDALSEEAAEAILDLPNVSREFASHTMSLAVPRYDRRTIEGTLTRWHVTVGTSVIKGDQLFDLRFDDLQSRLASGRNASDRSISLSVLAGRAGVVERITSQEGERVSVGTMVGVIVAEQGFEWSAEDVLTRFPIGVALDWRNDGE